MFGSGGAADPAAVRGRSARPQRQDAGVRCAQCDSTNTKFCYYSNHSLAQPRYFCRACRRYWTKGVPVGSGKPKHKHPVAADDADDAQNSAGAHRDAISPGSSSTIVDAVDTLNPLLPPPGPTMLDDRKAGFALLPLLPTFHFTAEAAGKSSDTSEIFNASQK